MRYSDVEVHSIVCTVRADLLQHISPTRAICRTLFDSAPAVNHVYMRTITSKYMLLFAAIERRSAPREHMAYIQLVMLELHDYADKACILCARPQYFGVQSV